MSALMVPGMDLTAPCMLLLHGLFPAFVIYSALAQRIGRGPPTRGACVTERGRACTSRGCRAVEPQKEKAVLAGRPHPQQ